MSRFSGIVSFHFSISSDIFAGLRDVRITIDEPTVPLALALSRLWGVKNLPAQVVAQHELLVFRTDSGGSAVFFKEKDSPELRARALNVKTAMVGNYDQVEVTLLKISIDQQRRRDAAEEADELLKSIEQRGQQANSSSTDGASANITASSSVTMTKSSLEQHQQSVSNNSEDPKQHVPVSGSDDQKRKNIIMAKKLPLPKSLVNLATLGDDIVNDDDRKSKDCLLCGLPIRIRPSPVASSSNNNNNKKPSVKCPNPNSNGRCRKVCCDACYDYAFNLKMMGMKCPVCGGDRNTKLVAVDAGSTTVAANGGSVTSQSPSIAATATTTQAGNTAMPVRRGSSDGDDHGNDLELLDQHPRKVRRVE